MSYRIIDTASKQEWLEQRQNYLTATDIAALYTGGPKTWARIAESKTETPDDFDNQYMAWGREREPVIAGYINTFVDSTLKPNDKLLVSTRHPRIAATPDMLGVDSIGDTIIAEIKTSKTPLFDIPLKYMVQMQVQLLVTGAETCVFAWEQHEDFVPMGEIHHEIVRPDPAMRDEILRIVDRFFGVDAPDHREERLSRLMFDYRALRQEIDILTAREADLKEQIKEMLGDEDTAVSTPGGKISWTLPKPRTSFDAKAFQIEHPDLYEQFVKETVPASRTLRITLPKDEG